MNGKENEKLENEIKTIIENSIESMDFTQLNQKINQTLNTAFEEAKNKMSESMRSAVMPKHKNQIVKSKPKEIKIPYKEKGSVSGVLASIFGSVGVFIFGTATLVLLILAMAFHWASIFLCIILGFLPFLIGSICLLGNGIRLRKLSKRSRRYLAFLKEKGYCSIESLSKRMGISVKKVREDIKKMLSKGIFPQGALDEQETCFIGNQEYYRQYQDALESYKQRLLIEEKADKEREQNQENYDRRNKQIDAALAEGRVWLDEIRKVQNQIYEPQFSGKLQRLQTVVEQIFSHVHKYPAQLEEIRKFMEYYLPTTLKLVKAYENFASQPIQGENITQAKEEIQRTLENINDAFERLLDSLYEDVTMDVSTDITVLQTMLAQEGLTERDFNLSGKSPASISGSLDLPIKHEKEK